MWKNRQRNLSIEKKQSINDVQFLYTLSYKKTDFEKRKVSPYIYIYVSNKAVDVCER
jgi:hypothetical protein